MTDAPCSTTRKYKACLHAFRSLCVCRDLEFVEFEGLIYANTLFGSFYSATFVDGIMLKEQNIIVVSGFIQKNFLFLKGDQRTGVVAHDIRKRYVSDRRQKVGNKTDN